MDSYKQAALLEFVENFRKAKILGQEESFYKAYNINIEKARSGIYELMKKMKNWVGRDKKYGDNKIVKPLSSRQKAEAAPKFVLKTKDNKYLSDKQGLSGVNLTDNILEARLFSVGYDDPNQKKGIWNAQSKVSKKDINFEIKNLDININFDKPIKFINPEKGKEKLVYKINNFNEETGRAIIEPINLDFGKNSIVPTELVSIKDLKNS